jgi:hypothetical protein
MSNLTESGKLPVERRNEIATRALVYMKINHGFRVDFQNYEKDSKKKRPDLARKINCTEDELKKFIKEGMFTIFQHYCETVNIKPLELEYKPAEDKSWVKRRHEIGFALFIHESTEKYINLHFRPDSPEKKNELCMAYQCDLKELKIFQEEIAHIMLTKAFAMY